MQWCCSWRGLVQSTQLFCNVEPRKCLRRWICLPDRNISVRFWRLVTLEADCGWISAVDIQAVLSRRKPKDEKNLLMSEWESVRGGTVKEKIQTKTKLLITLSNLIVEESLCETQITGRSALNWSAESHNIFLIQLIIFYLRDFIESKANEQLHSHQQSTDRRWVLYK